MVSFTAYHIHVILAMFPRARHHRSHAAAFLHVNQHERNLTTASNYMVKYDNYWKARYRILRNYHKQING